MAETTASGASEQSTPRQGETAASQGGDGTAAGFADGGRVVRAVASERGPEFITVKRLLRVRCSLLVFDRGPRANLRGG
jgi:hypothetical protein